ncbi:MAG: flavodoxin [Lachnospiraceae bacterium]|nr:flavodoxin [Lachnospiraceae bacterium]
MMKKVMSLLMAAVLVFALAACGQTQQTKPTDSSVTDTQPGSTSGSEETPAQSEPETTESSESPETTASSEASETTASSETPETTESSEALETTASVETTDTVGKTLIVYFSWSTSGNTEKMATYIQEQTGGDLLELEPLNPYPTDYEECGEVAQVERDENARPKIANLPESIAEYDTVFVGYPIWWHTAPMIIGTFLESYDLTGVEIYPFAQSASMDTEQFDNSMEFVREYASGANVHDGLFVSASDTEGMQAYLEANGFAQ